MRMLVSGVELLGAPALALGGDPEQASAVGVEDRRKDARRVKPRTAVPVDRPVGTDERDGVQVTDQAMLGDRQVARPLCPESSSGRHMRGQASADVERHYGTSTSFPLDAELSSSS